MADPLKNEQPHHLKAFEEFYALGDHRSYARLAEATGHDIETIRLWGRSFSWAKRVAEREAEEARAIAKVFPNGPDHLQVSSTKSMTGHLLGAAGAIEAIFSILAIRDGIIPPTINLENLDPGCIETKLNFTPKVATQRKVDYAISNSFGFGGTNASLIFGRV